MRVLIIDDNEMIRAVLRMIIQSDAHEVLRDACCGKSGLEQVKKLLPDVVFLDINMPNGNGLVMLGQIRQAFPQIAVIMVTADNDLDTVQTALKQGANGFIIKPFKGDTVLDALSNVRRFFQQRSIATME